MHKRREVGLFFLINFYWSVVALQGCVVLIFDEEGTTKDLLG